MCVLKPRVQKWVNFSKNGHFWPFFSGNFRDFRGFGGFPGEKFPGNRGIFRRNFPRGFSRNRLYLCAYPKKKQEKTARFFRGFPGDFPGDFPGISRRLFSEKTRIFPDFHPVLPTCTLFRSARSVKNPQISGKVPGDFRNSRESPEKISRNSRKFRPTGFRGKFSGISEISVISEKRRIPNRIQLAMPGINIARKRNLPVLPRTRGEYTGNALGVKQLSTYVVRLRKYVPIHNKKK